MTEAVVWLEDGCAHSPRFGDRYHSCSGPIAQSISVFMTGCGLPERWRGTGQFTILETGFGLGLNFLATWAAWEADPQRCERLHFVSVEAFPVSAAEMVRAAQASCLMRDTGALDPARLQVLAQELAVAWQSLSESIQTLSFAGGKVQLTLAVGDVGQMLPRLQLQADAVFLDGFSPSVNPAMWSLDTLQAVAQHCQPGTRLATYTVAKAVRLGLKQLGFAVKKCPGLPPKRDRLEASLVHVDGRLHNEHAIWPTAIKASSKR